MTDPKIKILFIHHGTGIGGAPISLLNLVKKLNQDKYEIKVAFVKGGVAEELFKTNGIKTDVIGSSNLWFTHNETGKIHWKYFYRYLKIFKHWRNTAYQIAPRYLANQDADIIHLNSHVLTSWAFAAKKMGKKVVLHNREAVARGYFGIRYRILKKLIEENCDAIINISQDNKKRLGIEEKAYVIYNFVNIPEKYCQSMEKDVTHRNVLYLGGMASIKGFDVTVKCLPYLNNNITLQFAGNLGKLQKGKSQKEKIKYWIKILLYRKSYKPLKKVLEASNTELLGLLSDPLKAIDECDILITPFKIEHFSRPAIEAFAYGKPVIGSNVEGMDEIIEHGINGLLVEKNNPKDLAKAINYLCENPDIARKMGQKGREKAIRLFSPEANTFKVEAIYDQLMEESKK